MFPKKSYCIHASNIAGMGSRSVVLNLLLSFSKIKELSNSNIYLYLPNIPFWQSNIKYFNENWTIKLQKRSKYKYIRLIQRVIDILFGHRNIPDVDILIVLGDFPLRYKKKQIILFHNLNIINEKHNFEFFFHKLFFTLNIQFITKFVIQSNIVKNDIIAKFPNLENKVQVLPMPVDEIYDKINVCNKLLNHNLECFYPASYYLHKNHKVIIDLCNLNKSITKYFHFYFTIPSNIAKDLNLNNSSLISNLGPLSKHEVYNKYLEVDVLIFPSLLESYGLPLIEAMKMNLYVVCADLPYAKWLCGEQAKYFDPSDPESLRNALEQTLLEKFKNIKPNWNDALSKIPKNWDSYSTQFLN